MGKVIVETMPDQHRASHRAAQNWGIYPHNGAERRTVEREEAEAIVAADPDGCARIVRDVKELTITLPDGGSMRSALQSLAETCRQEREYHDGDGRGSRAEAFEVIAKAIEALPGLRDTSAGDKTMTTETETETSEAAALVTSVYEQGGAWACADGHGNEIAAGLPSREAAERRAAEWVQRHRTRESDEQMRIATADDLNDAAKALRARGVSRLYPSEWESAMVAELATRGLRTRSRAEVDAAANERLAKGEAALHAARLASRRV